MDPVGPPVRFSPALRVNNRHRLDVILYARHDGQRTLLRVVTAAS